MADLEHILALPPDRLRQASGFPLTLAHMAYRMGSGPHLFRSGPQIPLRDGLMFLDDRGFSGGGTPDAFCREVAAECDARKFSGVICDLESHRSPLYPTLLPRLEELCLRKNLTLYVPEVLGSCCKTARVLISSALSGGSLDQRLREAVRRWGVERTVLAIERVSIDFSLPSPTGQGTELSREELTRLFKLRSPAVFFSVDLCAHYFTYTDRTKGTHFILFDDAASIRKKIQTAKDLGLPAVLMAYPQVDDLLDRILK